MTATDTTVMKSSLMYERLREVSASAGLSISALAREAGVNSMTLYQKKFTEGTWSTKTLNSVSNVLARRLERKPGAIAAYLTGLEDELPRFE